MFPFLVLNIFVIEFLLSAYFEQYKDLLETNEVNSVLAIPYICLLKIWFIRVSIFVIFFSKPLFNLLTISLKKTPDLQVGSKNFIFSFSQIFLGNKSRSLFTVDGGVNTSSLLKFAKQLKPSKRNELEITDLLNIYRKKNKLHAEYIGRGGAWLDTGSIEDFYKTSNFVSAIENRQGFKIACLEEISLGNKWIKHKDILNAIKFYGNSEYSKYLKKLIS